MTTITPGTKSPCMKRQKIRACRLCDVAASSVGTVSAYSEGTMTFFRPIDSASSPTTGAIKATARMVELTVRLIPMTEVL